MSNSIHEWKEQKIEQAETDLENQENTSQTKEELLLNLDIPLVFDWEKIYLEINNDYEKKLIISHIKKIFENWYYIKNINYTEIENAMFAEDFDLTSRQWKVEIWEWVEEFSKFEKEIYSKRFKEVKWQIKFDFYDIIYDDENNEEIRIKISKDKVIATLIENWIIYWIDEERISKTSQEDKKTSTIQYIAKYKEAEDWENASIEFLIQKDPDLRPVHDEKTDKVDLRRYYCTFPQIKDLEKEKYIAKKINATKWKAGRDIWWKEIKQKEWQDLNFHKITWEWTKILEEDWNVYITAETNWFIIYDKKTKKISVTKQAQNRKDIWPETWCLNISAKHFEQRGDVKYWYEVEWYNIKVLWNVEAWSVRSKSWNIGIAWNTIWATVSTKWWEIKIKWNVQSESEIINESWDISIEYAENSTIVWKNINIKKAVNCIIIWESINLDENLWSKTLWLKSNFKEIVKEKDWKEEIYIPIFDTSKLIDQISAYETKIFEKKEEENEIIKDRDKIKSQIEQFENDEKLKKLLEIYKKFKKWVIRSSNMSTEQKQKLKNITKLVEEKYLTAQKELEQLNKSINEIEAEIEELNNEIANINDRIERIRKGNDENWFYIESIQASEYRVFAYLQEMELDFDNLDDNTIKNLLKKIKWNKNHQFVRLKMQEVGEFVNFSQIEELFKENYQWDDIQESFGNQRWFHRQELISEDNIKKALENIDSDSNYIRLKINNYLKWLAFDISLKWVWIAIKWDVLKSWVNLVEWKTIKLKLNVIDEEFDIDYKITWIAEKDWYKKIWWYFVNLDNKIRNDITNIKYRLEILINKWYDPQLEKA